MNFLDGSLFPENQEKLVITAAPYGPEWMPADFPEDIPLSMAAQIQKAVDCYNAGATVVHIHVREEDGKGSKRLSKFNELLAGIRARAPELILQVGGSISFAPEVEGEIAKWLSDDTRHMLRALCGSRLPRLGRCHIGSAAENKHLPQNTPDNMAAQPCPFNYLVVKAANFLGRREQPAKIGRQ